MRVLSRSRPPLSLALSRRSHRRTSAWKQDCFENLALACLHCNRHKGPNIAGTDPNTGEIIRLFHPRLDRWNKPFEWLGGELCGRTTMGRVTIKVLAINDADFLGVREALIQEQLFPLE